MAKTRWLVLIEVDDGCEDDVDHGDFDHDMVIEDAFTSLEVGDGIAEGIAHATGYVMDDVSVLDWKKVRKDRLRA